MQIDPDVVLFVSHLSLSAHRQHVERAVTVNLFSHKSPNTPDSVKTAGTCFCAPPSPSCLAEWILHDLMETWQNPDTARWNIQHMTPAAMNVKL